MTNTTQIKIEKPEGMADGEFLCWKAWREAVEAYNSAAIDSGNPYTFESEELWRAVVVSQNRLWDFENRFGLGYLVVRVPE